MTQPINEQFLQLDDVAHHVINTAVKDFVKNRAVEICRLYFPENSTQEIEEFIAQKKAATPVRPR